MEKWNQFDFSDFHRQVFTDTTTMLTDGHLIIINRRRLKPCTKIQLPIRVIMERSGNRSRSVLCWTFIPSPTLQSKIKRQTGRNKCLWTITKCEDRFNIAGGRGFILHSRNHWRECLLTIRQWLTKKKDSRWYSIWIYIQGKKARWAGEILKYIKQIDNHVAFFQWY